MRVYQNVMNGLTVATGTLAAVSLLVIGLIVLAQIVGRNLGFLVAGADEIAVYNLSALSFLGLAYTLRDHAHIRIDTFMGWLPVGMRTGLYRLTAAFAGLFIGYLTYHSGEQLHYSVLFNERSQGLLGFPIWIPQVAMVVGLGLFALRLVGEVFMPAPALEAEEVEEKVTRMMEES